MMVAVVLLMYIGICGVSHASAIPHNVARGHRSMEKELSDADHTLNGHNAEYDHEAFLGKERAHDFDKMSPEESKKHLSAIVDKIDSDNDGKVTEAEMVAWIKYIQRRYITEDARAQWKHYELGAMDSMTWKEYSDKTYGAVSDDSLLTQEEIDNYKTMKERDYRRFKMADADYDDRLTQGEFVNFLHPEDAPHMSDVVVKETIDDLDKDKDGYISEVEYIGDMWPDMGKEEEPDWVKMEKEHFNKWRDLNKDGKLDSTEVRQWIMPDDYDHAVAESKHLIYQADEDKSGDLTKDEILLHHDTFVGSQATDFGQALTLSHDEF